MGLLRMVLMFVVDVLSTSYTHKFQSRGSFLVRNTTILLPEYEIRY